MDNLWDEQDGFFYDRLRRPDGSAITVRARSMVGLLPVFAAVELDASLWQRLPMFRDRARWYIEHKLGAKNYRYYLPSGSRPGLISLVEKSRFQRILARMLDEGEFLSPYGLRSLSRYHQEHPFMAIFSDPFDALSSFQRALDAFHESSWLDAGPSGGGAYPPMNVFRKGDDFVVITEIPGVKKSELEVQVKGRTLRLTGAKSVAFPEKAAVHRRERLAGRFDRAVTMPVEIDPDGVKAEYRDGILALFLPCAEKEKAKTIKIG